MRESRDLGYKQFLAPVAINPVDKEPVNLDDVWFAFVKRAKLGKAAAIVVDRNLETLNALSRQNILKVLGVADVVTF